MSDSHPKTPTPLEERKAQYEQSALKVLMEASGHEICPKCYCCDLVWETENCWQCGGFAEDDDPEWPESPCSVCGGEGEISYQVCIGRCDENGNHAKKSELANAD